MVKGRFDQNFAEDQILKCKSVKFDQGILDLVEIIVIEETSHKQYKW